MDTMTKRETLTAGDILHCGWGSDMSINDYYEVTRVTPSGKTAYIRPLRKTYAGNPNDMGGCRAYPMVAGEGRFSGEKEAHRVHHFDDGRAYLRLSSFEFAFPMDMTTRTVTSANASKRRAKQWDTHGRSAGRPCYFCPPTSRNGRAYAPSPPPSA